MKNVRELGMNAEDNMIFKAFLTFMMMPLVLLVATGAALALAN